MNSNNKYGTNPSSCKTFQCNNKEKIFEII